MNSSPNFCPRVSRERNSSILDGGGTAFSGMDASGKRVFRLDPFFLNSQIFYFAGYGYIRNGSKWTNALFGIYRFFCFFSITIAFFIQVVDVYLLLDNFARLTEDLCAIMVTFVVTIKMYAVSFRTDLVQELQREFLRFRERRTHPEEEEIWKRASWRVHAMTKAFYAMGTTCVLFWISFPALESRSGRVLPYPWLFPVDQYQSPYYEIIYVFQSLSLFIVLVNIVSVDLGYCSHVILMIARYEILGRDVREMSSAYDEVEDDADLVCQKKKAEESMKSLRELVDVHDDIFRQMRKLEAIHSDILFLQMSLTAFIIAVVVMDMIMNSRGSGVKFVQRGLYTLSTCFDTWIQCFWGSQLRQKSYDFAQELYCSSWFKMDVRVRKTMLMIMTRAQNAPKLRNGMFSVELPLFLEIMRYAYNAAALLINTT